MTLNPTDIAALIIHLEATMGREIDEELGRATFAHALDLIRQINPTLSAEIHDVQEQKIITTSGIMRDDATLLGEIASGDRLWMQITGLREDVVQILACYYAELLECQQKALYWNFGAIPWQIVGAEWHLPSGCASYAMLVERWRKSQVPRAIRLKFLNATTFRSDKRTYPLPEPRLVFGSLINRWQAFTNCRLRDLPDDSLMAFATHHIDIVDFVISAQAYGYKGDAELGFRGEVSYRFNRKSEYLEAKFPALEKQIRRDYDWYVRWMALLADFAAYSGVGRKTTTGMGLVRVSHWS